MSSSAVQYSMGSQQFNEAKNSALYSKYRQTYPSEIFDEIVKFIGPEVLQTIHPVLVNTV